MRTPVPSSPLAARSRDLAEMRAAPLDVLVIGGGITGAGVARDAAMRGLRTALVERRDFASGTSSRSSKLVHGGIRYLAQGDVPLVLEAAEERRVLRRIAPHLAQPRPMLIPCYGRGAHSTLKVGMWTYEKLASIPPDEHHVMLDAAATRARVPQLRAERLVGAALYPENVTDDARLVLATLRSARCEGALLASQAEVVALEPSSRGTRVRVRDVENGGEIELEARTVVNASGPWSDAVSALAGGDPGRRLRLTCGIHLVVRHEDLPIRDMIVVRAPDRRQAFAIPRGDVVYVGTTDVDHERAEDYPATSLRDVEYLLEALRGSFADLTWGAERVVATWAGLRPLIDSGDRTPSEISRKDEITVGAGGMITVAGGKLTTYRRMAERAVDLAARRLGVERACTTAEVPLDGAELGSTPERFAEDLVRRFGARLPGLDRMAARLVLHHGNRASELLERALDEPEPLLAGGGFLVTEVDCAVESEMALHLTDVLERRLRATLFDPERGLDIATTVADRLAGRLGWDEHRRARELDDYRRVAAACLPV